MDGADPIRAFIDAVEAPHAVVWFGAGVSMPEPTALPSGADLTWQWLAHLLPPKDLSFLRHLYGTHGCLLGRRLPRLEKVIEDAVRTFGTDVLTLLDLFRDVPPNHNHRLIAEHMVAHRAWAVTTNFDDAVERAAPAAIPVLTPTRGAEEDGWGLLKLHGSIDEKPDVLGHSIRTLARGLAPPLQARLAALLDDPSAVFVFVGYSGLDFFDVTPFFARFAERPRAARALWIAHDDAPPTPVAPGTLGAGAQTMLKAFAGVLVVRGWSDVALATALDRSACAVEEPAGTTAWTDDWPARFTAPDALRHLYAAAIYASIGAGRQSLDAALRAAAAGGAGHERWTPLVLNAVRDCGCYEVECSLHHRAAKRDDGPPRCAADWEMARKRAAALQLAGHPIRALLRYERLTRQALRAPPDDERTAEAQAWIFAEYGLAWRHLLVRIPVRRVFGVDPFAWARSLAGGEIRFRRDLALARYGAQIRDPHLTATFDRLQTTVSSIGGGGFTFLYFLRMMRRGVLPQSLPAPLSTAGEPQAIYQETDSLLGEVNTLRDSAMSLIGMLDRGIVRASGGEAATAIIGSALHALRRSHRLAARIDDLPGQIKALDLMAGLYGRLGAPVRAQALRRRARRKRRERCAACRTIGRLVAEWFRPARP